ncbi:hypothetical protein B5X24_HaOG215318 [Helicoverpa armigera]|uniref:STX17-like N-terminal domain-containing protein n=1 Tax=Helicoverpa armigera TaxID=29058 RepID=A0A2W1BCK9_HELAM|nr:hypothetical protein B5X24_HaOG215318 [Helicoverpa armigera]
MDDEDKLPLKRVEFSLNKFNEVAIPHHLDLLRQHKANIIKYSAEGEWTRARGEQTHARRVAAQLRALLAELDAMRRRVRAADLPRFDARTQRSRDTTLRAIVDYLGLIEDSCRALVASSPRRRLPETSPVSISRASDAQVAASATSTESVGVVAHQADAAEETQIQLVVDHDEAALREREELLRGWSELQSELRALHDVHGYLRTVSMKCSMATRARRGRCGGGGGLAARLRGRAPAGPPRRRRHRQGGLAALGTHVRIEGFQRTRFYGQSVTPAACTP